jgi:hypothetical protein
MCNLGYFARIFNVLFVSTFGFLRISRKIGGDIK